MNLKNQISPILLVCGGCFATPAYYAFEGTVNRIADTMEQPFAGGRITVGDHVAYVFLVDKELQGIGIHHQVAYAQTDAVSTDYFYAEYIGGTTQEAVYHSGSDVCFWGTETNNFDGTYGISLNGSEDGFEGYHFGSLAGNRVQIQGTTTIGIDNWHVGLGFRGSNEAIIEHTLIKNASLRIYSDLTLTGITDFNPMVPEPSTMVLFGLGAIGLGCATRLLRPKKAV